MEIMAVDEAVSAGSGMVEERFDCSSSGIMVIFALASMHSTRDC